MEQNGKKLGDKAIRRAYKEIFKAAPVALVCYLLMIALSGLAPTAIAIVTGYVVDAAISAVKGAGEVSAVIDKAIILCALETFNFVSKPIIEWLMSVVMVNLDGNLNEMIVEKHSRLAYWRLEDKASLDLIKQVEKKTLDQFKTALQAMNHLGIVSISAISALITITVYVWWVVPVVIVVIYPLIWLAKKGAKETYEEDKALNEKYRYVEMLDEVLLGKDSAKERYLFDYSDHYNEIDYKTYREVTNAKFKVMKKWFKRSKTFSSIFSLIVLVVALVLLKPVKAGTLTFGIYTSVIALVSTLINQVGWTIPNAMDAFTSTSLFFKDFFTFKDFDEEESGLIRPEKVPEFESLEFKDVRFTYPGTDREILKSMTFKIEKGHHYSLVGENGSGKSTVIKLMLGLYDQYEGTILINGVDARTMPLNVRRSIFSAIFQDYVIFGTTIKNNIAMGYADREAKVQEVIDDLDLREMVNKMPEGIETEIGKLDDRGLDLSGGQRQRIALARAIVSDSPVVILDEPTAAMDPKTESKLYEKMGKLTKGRTVIFISHRLGSTSLSDEIFLFKAGKVFEHGTHDEMMALKGDYYEMYNSQKEWYS